MRIPKTISSLILNKDGKTDNLACPSQIFISPADKDGQNQTKGCPTAT